MANSGYIQTNTSFGYVRLDWATVSQNVANNTSSVNYELVINRSGISSSAPKNYSVNINGVLVASGATTIGGSGTKTIATGNITIGHNADGTKSFSFSFSQQVDITWSGSWIGTVTGSGSGVLNTIPRATTPVLPASAADMGTALVINTPRAATSFTHTLRYGFGNLTGTIATGVTTAYSWTIPMNLANQIGNATSGVGTIWCDTYNNGALIGTKAVAYTARVPESVKPYFTAITATESIAGLAAKFGAYVQHKSKVSIVSNALGAYSSQIVSYRHEISGTNWQYLSKDFVSGFLPSSGSITITSYCTDTRGRTGSATTTINVLPYEPPRINQFNATRALSNGTENYDGTHLKCSFNFNISALNNLNTRLYQIQYKLKSASGWTTLTENTAAYSANSTYTSSGGILSDVNSYDVRFVVSDYFSTATAQVDVGTAFTLIDYRNTGRGMGIGKVSEKDALEIAIPVEISGQPIKGGAITVLSTAQQTISSTDYVKCNLNSTLGKAGSNLTLSNNEIVCQNSGVVEVSGMISLTGGITAGDKFYAFIFREHSTGTTALNLGALLIGTDWATINVTPTVTAVNAGDKISLRISAPSGRGVMGNADNVAWMNKLTVKYVG